MMAFIGWVVFGFVVGVIARFLIPGPHPMGFIMTTLLGVAGSFLGGWLGTMIHGGPADIAEPASWLGSIIGAVLLLLAYGFLKKRDM
jgi:uncharacterized membrane protein YeaQ/YmgE (transglycosylase-associated protein family)